MKTSRESVPCKDICSGDREISQVLRRSVAYIEAPDELKQRIDRQISETLKKEEKMKKHIGWKKVGIGVVAACLLIGTGCLAAGGVKYFMGSSSSSHPDYTAFSDLEKAEADVGYQVNAVESFDNGFTFESITISKNSLVNESGTKEENQKGINIRYQKDDETVILFIRRLYQMELEGGVPEENPVFDASRQIGEVQAGFRQITNKFVPPDYELTEEDMKNMENPNFNLAYGTSEVENDIGFSVFWVQDGVCYDLYGTDLSIDGEEMLDMAEKIITNE